MTDGITIDTTELDRLSADLGEASRNVGPYLRAAIEHTAIEIRDTWRDKASGIAHAPAFPGSITYDVKTFQGFGASTIEAEIGPDKERPQGALGNLIEFGSVNNPPWGIGHAALEENQDDFEHGIDEAIADALAVVAADTSIRAAAAAITRGRFR